MKAIARALALSILTLLFIAPAAVTARKDSQQSSRANLPKLKKRKKQKFKKKTLNSRHGRRKNPPKP